MSGKYAVGQTVVLRDVNERRHGSGSTGTFPRGEVVRVGRTLIDVRDQYGNVTSYRLPDGYKNDRYQHGWIETEEEHAEAHARAELASRLRDHGLSFTIGSKKLSTETLSRLLAVMEDDT